MNLGTHGIGIGVSSSVEKRRSEVTEVVDCNDIWWWCTQLRGECQYVLR